MVPKSERRIVGSPLTPAMVREAGGFERLPAAPDDFDPSADGANLYRIWTCHGYMDEGNKNVGYLRIERRRDAASGGWTLAINQEILHDRANLQQLSARVTCRDNPFESPLEWTLNNRFVAPDGKPRRGLAMSERSRVRGDTLEITAQDRTYRRRVSRRVTADWRLFDAIQRMTLPKEPTAPFDLLEGLSLVRTDQRLVYRGLVPWETTRLHWVQQWGHGGYPYEYWLDERRRLVLVVFGARVYILDAAAVRKHRQQVVQSRQSQMQRKTRSKQRSAS